MKKFLPPKPILAVGGLDSSGHAGLLADARVFERLGLAYRVAATAITAQSEEKIFSWQAVPPRLFRQEMEAAGASISGVKIGMLATLEHAKVVLHWLRQRPSIPLLWDPVLRSSTGGALLRARHWAKPLQQLLERTDFFTPNLPEAEWILGERIRSSAQSEAAIKKLHRLGKRPRRLVILKGGHLLEKSQAPWALDQIYDGKVLWKLKARRRPMTRRGTGCSFGAALLAAFIQGKKSMDAVRFAKRYVLLRLLDAPSP